MSTLRLVKVKEKHTSLFAALLLYFNGQRLAALRRSKAQKNPENYIHPIGLLGVYEAFKVTSRTREIVKMAAGVFFENVYRGNNISKQCSGWKLREHPHLNNQIRTILPELFNLNKDFIFQVSSVAMGKDDTVKVTTEFKFNSPEEADLFRLMMQAQTVELD